MRSGSASDLPALLRIEQICFVGDYASHRFRKRDFAAYMRNPSALFRIAEMDGEPIAYVAGRVRRVRGEMNARLDGIAVLPKYRRQGVGDRLLDWFLNAVKQRNGKLVRLEVLASNQTKQAWFARAGFHEIRRLRNYYGAGLDGIEMQR